MTELDDTQPRSPFKDGAPAALPPEPPDAQNDDDDSGPGCLVWGLLGMVGLGTALLVVVMSAAAGWTSGQQIADRSESSTQAAIINQQLARIPTDVAEGNQYNLSVRLGFLATLTPAVPAVPEIQQTATALYFDSLPTETPIPPTETLAPDEPEITDEPLAEEAPATLAPDGAFDLPGLLAEARDQIARGEYADAYDTLDVIIRVDANFERSTVRGLMSRVLTTRARNLYATTENLAEAIRLTDMAEEYGSIDDLSYERELAGLYLDAQRATGAGDHAAAIRAINGILRFQSTYKGININEMLFNEYVRYANAWRNGSDYCQAVVYYNRALNLFNRQDIVGQRDNAQRICEEGTPVPEGEQPDGEGAPTIAPVGQPGT